MGILNYYRLVLPSSTLFGAVVSFAFQQYLVSGILAVLTVILYLSSSELQRKLVKLADE